MSERKTGFCLPSYTLPHPPLQLTDCLIPDKRLIPEGEVRERRWSECHVNQGCLISNILYLLAHWTEALLLARGANKPERSSGSSKFKGVFKKILLALNRATAPPSLSLSVCACGQMRNVSVCTCDWCVCVCVCVCAGGGCVELCCRTAGYPQRGQGFSPVCHACTFSFISWRHLLC